VGFIIIKLWPTRVWVTVVEADRPMPALPGFEAIADGLRRDVSGEREITMLRDALKNCS
jgi:hypothetical protein